MNTKLRVLLITLLAVMVAAGDIFGQMRILRGREGDICFGAERTWVETPPDGTANLYNNFINCVAEHYANGEINLYEVRQRVGHGTELRDALVAISWNYCGGAGGSCVDKRVQYLFNLDSDGDGLEDVNDPTPFGGKPQPVDTGDDQDGDGVVDAEDYCADTPSGTNVNAEGCPQLTIVAETVYPFYSAEDASYTLIGKVWAPSGTQGLADALVYIPWYEGEPDLLAITDYDGAFEVDLPALDLLSQTYNLVLRAEHSGIASNKTTVTFAVRPSLSVSVTTVKSSYLANEVIQITGQVFSPEPIGSDLDIQCEIRVYDQYGTNAPPYRVQRVHLRSDGTFTYEVPIYGPDEEGKWLESGQYGTWMVQAVAQKDGKEVSDLHAIDVYKTQVGRNKALRKFWNRINGQETIQTASGTHVYQRESHNEAIILGPQTEAVAEAISELENRIKTVNGAIMYLKDMRHKLTEIQAELAAENSDDFIVVEGLYIQCTSPNSAFLLEADPETGTDRLTVYHGPVSVASKTRSFPNLQVKTHDQLIVNERGVQDTRSLSFRELREAGQAFETALGGISPATLRHQSDPYAEELSPDYRPGFTEILIDYAYYIGAGILVLALLVVLFRKSTGRKTKTREDRKKAEAGEWEAAAFCTQCGQAIPRGSRFCPACGARQAR